ncbi:MAG: YfcC family protein, partial [Bacteroidales bacterium]|nr:YfcC family protein [Bacteroidales bacterium]
AVEGSFHYVEPEPQTYSVFFSLFEGFVDKADIIVFVLMVGGAFWILNSTKAIDAGVHAFVRFTRRCREKKALRKVDVDAFVLALIMLMFSLFGAVFGMSEETIAFIIIFVPMAVSMGYDSLTGVAVSYLAAHVGFAGAMLNPFTIGIAQGIAGVPLFSGLEYRFFCWVILTAIAMVFVLWYAKKVKKNPEISPVYKLDAYWRERAASVSATETVADSTETPATAPAAASTKAPYVIFTLLALAQILFAVYHPFTHITIGDGSLRLPLLPILAALYTLSGFWAAKRSLSAFNLHILLFTILYLVTGVLGYGWYIMEISALFLVMGICSGLAAGKGLDKVMQLFLEGVKDILVPAMVIGLASGIIFILQEGKVIDTILYGVSKTRAQTGEVGSVGVRYVFQTLLNLVMPSGSAKAALTMPIMGQFADLIHLSRQTAVLAFQFGDGFTNMITPTSG